MDERVYPRQRWSASIDIPGDKSLSHRALLFGALASGTSRVDHLLTGEDCLSTMRCLEQLGVNFDRISDDSYLVKGKGFEGLKESFDILDAGNSGTTIRLMAGILAGLPFFSCMTGDGSLRKRPMKRVIEPLRQMGAMIWARGGDQYAPMAFRGSSLKGVNYAMPVASAQVKSAIILAGLQAEGETRISEPVKTRDHTENMIKAMGGGICVSGDEIIVSGKQSLKPFNFTVPGDFSSASYFLAASAALRDGWVKLKSVGVNETRTGFMEILKSMGAQITVEEMHEGIKGEPVADLISESGALSAATVEGAMVPRCIDELPLLAVMATQAQGTTVVRDARELRVKETDRIAAIAEELKKMGAEIEEREDGFEVSGPIQLKGASVKSHGDHRIAMSLAVAALFASGYTLIEDSDCVDISFPQFFTLLSSGSFQ